MIMEIPATTLVMARLLLFCLVNSQQVSSSEGKMDSLKVLPFVVGTLLIGGLFATGVGCGERNKSARDKQSLTSGGAAVTSTNSQVQNQWQQSQMAGRQFNIDAKWEDVSEPVLNGQRIEVLSTFVYNGTYYQVNSTHAFVGNSRPATFTATYPLTDGVSLTAIAACSDVNCSQYAIAYNFKKGGADAIQQLVWIDFTQTSAPRIHSSTGGQFWDINAWYKFASDTNNFLDP